MKRDGFTILEVMIFLAISAMMLLIAVVGSGEMAKRARFTGTVDGVQSTIQQYYEQVVSGVNTRTVIDGCTSPKAVGTDSCLLLGRTVTINSDKASLTIRYIVGQPNVTAEDRGVYDNIATATLSVSNNTTEQSELQWGAQASSFSRGSAPETGESKWNGDAGRTDVDTVAFVRDPRGSQIVSYYFMSGADITNALKTAAMNHASTAQTTAALCIRNQEDWGASSPVAAIVFGVGSGSSMIDSNFQPKTGSGGIC